MCNINDTPVCAPLDVDVETTYMSHSPLCRSEQLAYTYEFNHSGHLINAFFKQQTFSQRCVQWVQLKDCPFVIATFLLASSNILIDQFDFDAAL
ncbi:hypothetical protein MAR_001266 [Mya arenaria]|uniref:Uncharacterized protein n=1 Tax=Mya arenaria TaxID=6604 RepID=A0ABY7FB83_MYAAR|nr:hypothetical protein MAR_001266 [Mya arenaria]